MKYGQNNTKFTSNKEKNEIYQSLMGCKKLNKKVTEDVYEFYNIMPNPKDFLELFLGLKNIGLSKAHIETLVKIDYFSEVIEESKTKCLWLTDNFKDYNKKTLKKDNIDTLWKKLNMSCSIMEFYNTLKEKCKKETDNSFTFEENVLISILYKYANPKNMDKLEELAWECKLLGTTVDKTDDDFMLGQIIKYNPRTNKVIFKHISNGDEDWYKINCPVHLKENDYIFISSISSYNYRGRTYYTIENMVNLNEKYLDKKSKKNVDK